MVNIKDMMLSYQGEGYSEINAQARVCQDIVLKAISDRMEEIKIPPSEY